jgi:hypothetical protein
VLRYCSACNGCACDTELSRFRSGQGVRKTSSLLRLAGSLGSPRLNEWYRDVSPIDRFQLGWALWCQYGTKKKPTDRNESVNELFV